MTSVDTSFKYSVDQVFEALREFPSVSQRGSEFERLMVRFLLEDKVFADRFDEVVRWDQWAYNGGRVDTGIDLVAKEKLMEPGQLFSVNSTNQLLPYRNHN